MALQNVRSSEANKRPDPDNMENGQLAVNFNPASPGLFFRDNSATPKLIKVGPVHVGSSAPNSTPATGGETGNSVGEQWLDTTGGNYDLKVWDGSAWRSLAGEFVNADGDTMTGTLTFGINADTNAIIVQNTSGTQNVIRISKDASDSGNIYLDDSSGTNNVRFFGGTGDAYFAGEVGIGLTNPLADLHISNASPELRIQDTDGTNQIGRFRQIGAGSYYEARNNTGGGNHVFRSYNGSGYTERFRIDSNGKVGIGDSSPDATLDIKAQTSSALRLDREITDAVSYIEINADRTSANGFLGGTKFEWNGTEVAGIKAKSGPDTTNKDDGQIVFETASAGSVSERMRIDSSGNVGIGLSDPSALLHLSSSNPKFILTDPVTDVDHQLQAAPGAGNFVIDVDANSGASTPSLLCRIRGSDRLRIDSSGSIRIGTGNPAATLDLDGNYASNVTAVSALDIDCSDGNYFTKTINANSEFTFSNVPSSRAYSFTLELTHTSGTVTFPTSVKFNTSDGLPPSLTTGKTHLFMFVTDDGGTRFRAAALVDYDN